MKNQKRKLAIISAVSNVLADRMARIVENPQILHSFLLKNGILKSPFSDAIRATFDTK